MPITSDGWLTWAERWPYPAHKTNGGVNGLLGLAAHSAEGWERYLRDYAQNTTRKASWTFSNLRSGVLLQHYPITAQVWTSGAGYPNNNMPGMETEGLAGMPLNEGQKQNVVGVIQELAILTGRSKVERIGNRTSVPAGVFAIVEHTECTRWGAAGTQCPSNRYDWGEILARLGGEEDEMKEFDAWGLSGFKMTSGGVSAVNARQSFGVPAEAKKLHIEILSKSGYAVILNGSSGGDPSRGHAGRVGWARSKAIADGYEHCDIYLDSQGMFYIYAEDPANLPVFYVAHVTAWG